MGVLVVESGGGGTKSEWGEGRGKLSDRFSPLIYSVPLVRNPEMFSSLPRWAPGGQ